MSKSAGCSGLHRGMPAGAWDGAPAPRELKMEGGIKGGMERRGMWGVFKEADMGDDVD